MRKKVLVAMSGGVDSTVALLLLRQQGYSVCGATLKLFDGPAPAAGGRTCCSLEDVQDARAAAAKVGAPHYVFNFTESFGREVIRRFADSYSSGETPNPCIDCNRYIKFGGLLQRALLLEQDYIATGHYARVQQDPQTGRYLLLKPMDAAKDQTYALYAMTQEQLRQTLFPLGELTKDQVRELAREHGLENADKPDSQDICFVPDGDYAAFLEGQMHLPTRPGLFLDTHGREIGPHKGFLRYTIGQRKGLGLSFDSPRYVVEKHADTGNVVLGMEQELFQDSVTARDVNLISIAELTGPMPVTAKTRYRQPEAPATLFPLEDGRILVRFHKPQRAPAPGQAVVFYDGNKVVGGGTIDQ